MAIALHYADFRNLFKASTSLDADGHYEWAPTREAQSFEPFTSWQFSLPVTISLTASAEYHWYIAQQNEGTALARWKITSAVSPVGYQVSFDKVVDGGGNSEQSALITAGYTLAQARERLLKGVYIYAYDVGNDELYMADLYRCAFASASL